MYYSNQSFTENEAVINGETVQICQSRFHIKKSIRYEMQHLVQIA